MTDLPERWPVTALYDWLREEGIRPESNRYAIEVTLEQMRVTGLLEPIDAAPVAAVRVLAAAVDLDTTNAPLWNQYRKALEELMARGSSGGDDFERFMAEVGRAARSGAAVRDASAP